MTYITQDIMLQFKSYLKDNCPACTENDTDFSCERIVAEFIKEMEDAI